MATILVPFKVTQYYTPSTRRSVVLTIYGECVEIVEVKESHTVSIVYKRIKVKAPVYSGITPMEDFDF